MSVASTGLPELDRALGGLYWGDNVVLDSERPVDVEPLYRAAREAPVYDRRVHVVLERDLPEIDGLETIDARTGSGLDRPRPLLAAVARHCAEPGRHLVLFDPLETMSERWGQATAGQFFARGCPMLLGLGAIAYWSLTAARNAPALRREIEGITQCVLVVGGDTLRIAKAEGRPPGVEGLVFRYGVGGDGRPVVSAAPTASRLGVALRALRLDRRLSQAGLARLAGVSPSAISQAERGRRGLSLDTLLDLSAKLNISLDELLRGELSPGYRLARRDDPRHADRDRPVTLIEDAGAGLRVFLVRLSPGGTARPEFSHKGLEIVTVATGLIQVQLATGRPVLRQGEALLADRSGVEGWRNLTDREAVAFWSLYDPVRANP